MAKNNGKLKASNILRATQKAIHLYFEDKKEMKDLDGVSVEMLKYEFLRQRKELHDIGIEHRIMKRILIEHNLWETLLNDDEFLEFLREDYEG